MTGISIKPIDSLKIMRVVALISGGKDSCYNMMQCVAESHSIVALANLQPKSSGEQDSYMYQTVGHDAISVYAEAMGLPLFRRTIDGACIQLGSDYTCTANDEVEDLYELLKEIKEMVVFDAVSVGAILSDYQRVRVENVCARLQLTPLSYLWRRDQRELLNEMIECRLLAIVIKVAALGLKPSLHLGMTIADIYPHMIEMEKKFGLNVCGEGGEYETFTLDCPLFKKRIVLDESEMVLHSDDAFAPVAYLRLNKLHFEQKDEDCTDLSGLSMKTSAAIFQELATKQELQELESEECIAEESPTKDVCPNKDTTLALHESRVYHSRDEHGFVHICGIVVKDADGAGAAEQTAVAMTTLSRELKKEGLNESDLVAIYLYVKSMADFEKINSQFHFSLNPAVRVCVQVSLPRGMLLQMDCVAHRSTSDMARHTMHVQGLSHWAPASIAPYSQAVKIGPVVYVAGQIALQPASLQMLSAGPTLQSRLALRHVCRVLVAMATGVGLRHVTTAICYVTRRQYIPAAKKVWTSALAQEQDTGGVDGEDMCCPLVEYLVVPALPRGALVEWQVCTNEKLPSQIERHTSHTSAAAAGEFAFKSVCHTSPDDELYLPVNITVDAQKGHVFPHDMVNELFNALLSNLDHLLKMADRTMKQLTCLRIYYRDNCFSHHSLHRAYEQSFTAILGDTDACVVSMVPVHGFESSTQVLSVCH